MDNEPISFIGSFPSIATAIRVHGDGGARIVIDIPENELPAIARLLLMRGKAIKVTVEDIPTDDAKSEEKHGLTKWHRPNR